MDLSLPILLLIVFGVAVGGYAIGVQVARRTVKEAPSTSSPVVVIPDTLADLALRLAKERELGPFLQAAAVWLRDEYRIPLVVIYPHDPATNELISPVVTTIKQNVPALRKRIRLGVSVYGEVAQNRISRFVPSIAKEPRFGQTAHGIQSAYVLPLVYASTLLGVLCLQSDKSSAWDEAERWVFDRIADLISGLAAAVIRLGYTAGHSTL